MKMLTIGISAATTQISWFDELCCTLYSLKDVASFIIDLYCNSEPTVIQDYKNKIKKLSLLGVKFQAVRIRHSGFLGESRNWIIQKSNTKYLIFVDGDDNLYAPKIIYLLDCLKKTMRPPDVIVFTGVISQDGVQSDWLRSALPNHSIRNKTDLLQWFMDTGWRFTSGALKIYDVVWLKKNKILFPSNYFYEDTPFWFEVIQKARAIEVIPIDIYVYRRWGGPQITENRNRKLFDIFWIFIYMEGSLSRSNAKEQLLVAYHWFVLDHLAWSKRQVRRSNLSFNDKLLFAYISLQYIRASTDFLVANSKLSPKEAKRIRTWLVNAQKKSSFIEHMIVKAYRCSKRVINRMVDRSQ